MSSVKLLTLLVSVRITHLRRRGPFEQLAEKAPNQGLESSFCSFSKSMPLIQGPTRSPSWPGSSSPCWARSSTTAATAGRGLRYKCSLFLEEKSPTISGHFGEFTGECNLGILYSSSHSGYYRWPRPQRPLSYLTCILYMHIYIYIYIHMYGYAELCLFEIEILQS